MPPGPITGPAAWLGEEMASNPDRWIYTFDDQDLAEIDTAIHGATSAGINLADLTPETFVLKRLGSRCTSIRWNRLRRVTWGWVLTSDGFGQPMRKGICWVMLPIWAKTLTSRTCGTTKPIAAWSFIPTRLTLFVQHHAARSSRVVSRVVHATTN